MYYNALNSQENQISALRDFASRDVDAIVLAPVIETGWNEVLREIREIGIPVVIVDRNVTADESLYLTRVSSDFVHEGRLAAAWLVQATSGRCAIVELQGTVGSSAARDRQIGFNQVISLFPEMQIVVSQSGDFRRNVGREVMSNILSTEDPSEICALWSHNDDMAIGAIEAIKEVGLDPGDDILVVSVDAIPDIFIAMANGDANATVELSPNMGGPAFDAIRAHLDGGGNSQMDSRQRRDLPAQYRSGRIRAAHWPPTALAPTQTFEGSLNTYATLKRVSAHDVGCCQISRRFVSDSISCHQQPPLRFGRSAPAGAKSH